MSASVKPLVHPARLPEGDREIRNSPMHVVSPPLGIHPVSSGCLQARQAATHSWKVCSCWLKCDSAWTRLQTSVEHVPGGRLCVRCGTLQRSLTGTCLGRAGGSRQGCQMVRAQIPCFGTQGKHLTGRPDLGGAGTC